MDTLDNETIEQIKNLVNDAKNNKTPLQKVKRTKKTKEIRPDIFEPEPEIPKIIELVVEPVVVPVVDEVKIVKSTVKKIKPFIPVVKTEDDNPEVELQSDDDYKLELVVPEKKKKVQSEKQKEAFKILQAKRKEQLEKLKLIKKIEASKILLENDIPLKVKKSPKTTLNFDEDATEDSEESEEEEKPKKTPKTKKTVEKEWGTSTRNKKSIKAIKTKSNDNINMEPLQTIFF